VQQRSCLCVCVHACMCVCLSRNGNMEHCLSALAESNEAFIGLAITKFTQCINGNFGEGITKYTVIYSAYIRFWPTLECLIRHLDVAKDDPFTHNR